MKLFLAALLAAFAIPAANAQTSTFTWNGPSEQGGQLTTINGEPTNPSIGYGGSIDIVNGQFLWLLDLPESLGFPNNGFLDCETPLMFSAKQWGTRSDGVQMDGTQAGDYYTIRGTMSCPLSNGTTLISIREFREMIQHRSCYHGACKTYLTDTEISGYGTAVVD